MAEFVMPSLGADMDEGTLVEWLVKVGDTVHRGDIVAVVDTTKSAIEVEVFTDGVVQKLLIEPGTTVPVGTPLAVLAESAEAAAPAAPPSPMILEKMRPSDTESLTFSTTITERGEPAVASPIVRHLAHERGIDLAAVSGTGPEGVITREDLDREAAPSEAAPSEAAPSEAAPSEAAPVGATAAAPPSRPAGSRVAASPLARRRAADLGIDLTAVDGSGPGGAISVGDVEKAAAERVAEPSAAPAPTAVPKKPRKPSKTKAPEPAAASDRSAAAAAKERAAAMRQTIGNLMARSKKEIPHYYLRTTVDFAAAEEYVRRLNAGVPVSERILPAVVLLKAAALAIRKVPEMNGFFVDGAFQRSDDIHLGVAVSLRGGGLVAPAIHDADTLALPDLMAALKDLVARTRAGRLRGSEMSDPTITVTNLGEQGVEVVHGVIYPPQVALVGFGKVVQRPWAVDGMLTVRPIVTATLAADHRVSDGHRGALYLAAVDDLLQRPEEL
jgi:pyruvate dehydrogenase E2 component (dihydrolipoamide acetyltransferase)